MRKPSWWYWTLPKGASAFFLKDSDNIFKLKHPVLYPLVVLLGIAALLAPCFLYSMLIGNYHLSSTWMLLGYVGAFITGIGFFNLVAIILRQYLGHWLTLCSWLLGTTLMIAGLLIS